MAQRQVVLGIRIAHEGTRAVLIFNTSNLFSFMATKPGYSNESERSLGNARACLGTFTTEDLQAYCNAGTIWKASLSAHDCIIVPAGCVTWEQAGNSDVYGHKMGVFLTTPLSKSNLEALHAEAAAWGGDVAGLDHVIQKCGLSLSRGPVCSAGKLGGRSAASAALGVAAASASVEGGAASEESRARREQISKEQEDQSLTGAQDDKDIVKNELKEAEAEKESAEAVPPGPEGPPADLPQQQEQREPEEEAQQGPDDE